MADFLQFDEHRNPGTFHSRIDLAESFLANASTRAVAHEFRALGFQGVIRYRRAFMHPPYMLGIIVFTRDNYALHHGASVDAFTMRGNVLPTVGGST